MDIRSPGAPCSAWRGFQPVNVASGRVIVLDALVDVTFRIGEKRIERSFSVPVSDDPKRKVNVVLYGGRSLIDEVRSEDLSVEMVKDAGGVERPSVSLPPHLVDRVEIRRPRADR